MIVAALTVWAGCATFFAAYYRGEYEALRRYHLKAMQSAQVPFVRALPPEQDNVLPFPRLP